jgi:hypothetical protein
VYEFWRSGNTLRLETASPLPVGLVCACFGLAVLLLPYASIGITAGEVTVLSCLAYAIPGLVFEFRRKQSTYRWAPKAVPWPRVVAKTAGLAQIFAVAFAIYYARVRQRTLRRGQPSDAVACHHDRVPSPKNKSAGNSLAKVPPPWM